MVIMMKMRVVLMMHGAVAKRGGGGDGCDRGEPIRAFLNDRRGKEGGGTLKFSGR